MSSLNARTQWAQNLHNSQGVMRNWVSENERTNEYYLPPLSLLLPRDLGGKLKWVLASTDRAKQHVTSH